MSNSGWKMAENEKKKNTYPRVSRIMENTFKGVIWWWSTNYKILAEIYLDQQKLTYAFFFDYEEAFKNV